METHPSSWIGRTNIVKMSHVAQSSLHIQNNPYQNTINIFHRAGTTNPKICMESEKTLNLQRNVEKENQSWRHRNSGLQIILQSCSYQDSMVLAQKQTHRSMEQNREPRNGPSTLWSTDLWQSREEYPMEKDRLFNKWRWENWISSCRRMKVDHFLTTYTKTQNGWKT